MLTVMILAIPIVTVCWLAYSIWTAPIIEDEIDEEIA